MIIARPLSHQNYIGHFRHVNARTAWITCEGKIQYAFRSGSLSSSMSLLYRRVVSSILLVCSLVEYLHRNSCNSKQLVVPRPLHMSVQVLVNWIAESPFL